MIELLLNDIPYEQDIRELFMAFYPGEEYCYEPGKKAFIIFKADRKGSDYDINISIENKKYCFSSPVLEDRFSTKNELKRNIYKVLAGHCNKNLPWGTLTGIRPTKLALKEVKLNKDEADIKAMLKKEYLVSEQKAKLCVDTAINEENILKRVDYNNGYSMYIGIPFCPTRCLYCSFTAYPIQKWESNTKKYLEALCKEIYLSSKMMDKKRLQSIYIGGGTPTSLRADELDYLLEFIKENINLEGLLEFTVEAGRADSITEDKLLVLKKHGIDRISVNPQTMNQKTLDLIGRKHSVEEVKQKFYLARELGFSNINMDIILGLPKENIDDVRHTLEEIHAMRPDSLTVHTLAIKRAARLNENLSEYIDKINSTKEMIELSMEYTGKAGYMPYYLYRQKNMAGNFENVGYALSNKECIYNILIMEELQTIIACGAGSSSKIVFPEENRLERIENVKDPDLYIERLDEMIKRKSLILTKNID